MKRIDALIIVLIISICCAGIAFAEENNSSVEQSIEETEISEDGAIYTLIASISGDEIKFNDGFTGYCIDSSKGAVSSDDKFTPGPFKNDKTENYVKLAIIECYKQGRVNDIGKVVSKIVNNDLDSSDSVIKEVLNSNENVNSGTTVKIDNTTEATFNFELLTPADSEKSDCLAYTVSMKTVENKNPSTVQKDDTLGVSDNSSDNDKKAKDDNVEKTTGNGSDEKTKEDTSKTEDTSKANKTDDKAKNDTIVNETNKTIVNKTNTKITVENNTTITYKNNVKTVNQTAPANNTTNNLLKTAGNPIFILGVVIVVALIAVAFMRRKD